MKKKNETKLSGQALQAMLNEQKINDIIGEYKFGFITDAKAILDLGHGLSESIIRKISESKQEPEWMLDFRLEAYEHYLKMPLPNFGPDLSKIDFDAVKYFVRVTERPQNSWEDIPQEIKETFSKIGIPEAERKFLAGVSTQFESEVVYHRTEEELNKLGVIFLDTDSALKKYPDIFKKYFASVVKSNDNKFSALNSAVWSGGSFVYVPKGVKIDKPLQSYFRINGIGVGQFERSLIIVEDEASLNYVEGCTAPIYDKDNLHAAVVEIIVKKNAHCRYSTIQNWSNNVINLVTQRANVYQGGHMEWIDGNIGSGLNMKYPCCVLLEPFAKGSCVSIAFAGKNQNQDAGAKMIHLAPRTTSTIISKSIAKSGGHVNYRGKVYISEKALNSKTHVECDTILLDDTAYSDTIPTNIIKNKEVFVEHEAKVSKVSADQLFYLMSRGLSEEVATKTIIMGFIEPFTKELPMEYAVELNQLIELEMDGSVG